jgi:hypothetical protein
MADELIFRWSRSKGLLLILLCGVFVVLGFWLVSGDDLGGWLARLEEWHARYSERR